jgi:hypothetical protein
MKKNYVSPAVEVISVNIERGFAESMDTTIIDYTKTGADSLDD